jgi:hypothetical protein
VESRCGDSGGGVKVRRVVAGEPCRVWMEWTGGVGAYIPTGVDLGFV